jgi:excisionase family DNA binding protein
MDKFYSIKQAAIELGKSRPTVYKMIREGKLKVQTVAGRPAIAIVEVERQTGGRPRKDGK